MSLTFIDGAVFDQAVRLSTIAITWALLGMSAVVLREYARNVRKGGPLPRYVAAISASYGLLIFSISAGNIALLSQPVTWRSFTILTGPSAGWLGEYHTRAPVILEPEEFGDWLDVSRDPAEIIAAVRPDRFELASVDATSD